jgi:hypothetical protein
VKEVGQREAVVETEDVGFARHALELPRRHGGRAVQERAGHGCDRDAFDGCALVIWALRAVEPEALTLAAPRGGREVDRRREAADQTPELRSRAVAQGGAGSGVQNGGHPVRELRLERPDPVDASMDRVEPVEP